ncbi:TetR/AcrR family transcriptional regulator [Microtetraspora sp. NBRC 16547]|uniref:TetR/AcrR family transcriptional regulator n=1 Tax=Microtetraspora sp. NBRC 16547 TaxID=3030993 RepID=UPI0024A1AD7A|nr:TetR/AcrR family transcriptional regulator [Microtetraspora sp. NBRC 16547]GLW98619.1 hypothetical protein Misp02_27060 [Microtetraspora sp. NBRC 16547]
MAASARRGSPLSSREIYGEALRLIDERGVEALSMRKLAAELDVNPMSLYHHVPNKEALLEGVCDLVISGIELPADDAAPWQEQLKALGVGLRAIALAHPALYPYLVSRPRLMRHDTVWEAQNRVLAAAGVPEERRPRIRNVLFAFTTGFLLTEINGVFPEPDDEAFDEAVDLIINGLSAYGSCGESGA